MTVSIKTNSNTSAYGGSALGAYNGARYLESLRDGRNEIWYRGERVKDVTTQPELRGIAESIARIYDMQHDPEYFCPKPWQRMSITHEGKVYQCNSDYNGLGVMGDANTDKLIDIWHGDAFNRVREAFKNHTYLKDNKPCLFCTEGVVTKEDEINVGARVMKVRGYKLINNVSDESGITFKDTISDNSWNEDD